ncbi:MAG: DJ-1/PfpI family protein [Candidatus Lokiarchaeota archaeon]|nr:DJ-1/PfpI family protein [Candidatus Lokiarchaeota archaeon]
MKEVLCFIYDGFADFETVLTCSALNEHDNYRVTYIAYEKTPVYSSGGLKINPDKTVSEIDGIKDVEGLIIPGGGTRILKPELEKLIKRLNEEKKLLAAICAGPEFLAKTGILNGKKYTASAEPQSYEEKNETDPFPRDSYVETRVIQDGNIITAKGHAFTDFALKIWDWYNLYDNEKEKEDLRKDFTPE